LSTLSHPEPARRAPLGERLRRLPRIVATGLSFLLFGLGALVLTFPVIPLCLLWPGSRDARELRVQRAIHYAYRFFGWFMRTLGLISVDWHGAEKLRAPGPHLIVANHPTLIDTALLISQLPQADCIVGEQWARNVLTALATRAAHYDTNSDGAAVVTACAQRLREGRTVVLFPEGTRSPLHGLHPFRRGAAHIALAAGVPLEPVIIECRPRTLMRGQPWWDVPDRTARFVFRVDDPIPSAPFRADGVSTVLAARRLTAALRERIAARTERPPSPH